jgi:hypothetical protein
LEKEVCRCNEAKDLEMLSSLTTLLNTKFNNKILKRDKREDTDTCNRRPFEKMSEKGKHWSDTI